MFHDKAIEPETTQRVSSEILSVLATFAAYPLQDQKIALAFLQGIQFGAESAAQTARRTET